MDITVLIKYEDHEAMGGYQSDSFTLNDAPDDFFEKTSELDQKKYVEQEILIEYEFDTEDGERPAKFEWCYAEECNEGDRTLAHGTSEWFNFRGE